MFIFYFIFQAIPVSMLVHFIYIKLCLHKHRFLANSFLFSNTLDVEGVLLTLLAFFFSPRRRIFLAFLILFQVFSFEMLN